MKPCLFPIPFIYILYLQWGPWANSWKIRPVRIKVNIFSSITNSYILFPFIYGLFHWWSSRLSRIKKYIRPARAPYLVCKHQRACVACVTLSFDFSLSKAPCSNLEIMSHFIEFYNVHILVKIQLLQWYCQLQFISWPIVDNIVTLI